MSLRGVVALVMTALLPACLGWRPGGAAADWRWPWDPDAPSPGGTWEQTLELMWNMWVLWMENQMCRGGM